MDATTIYYLEVEETKFATSESNLKLQITLNLKNLIEGLKNDRLNVRILNILFQIYV